jgi:hypothetical protein
MEQAEAQEGCRPAMTIEILKQTGVHAIVWTNGLYWDVKMEPNSCFGAIRRSGYKNAIFEPVKPFIMNSHFRGFGGL